MLQFIRLKLKSMLSEADRKTIARGNNPAATDSFAIEYNVRPLPEKVTIRTYEAELVHRFKWQEELQKDRQAKRCYCSILY